jgi:hypothetical protein
LSSTSSIGQEKRGAAGEQAIVDEPRKYGKHYAMIVEGSNPLMCGTSGTIDRTEPVFELTLQLAV